MGAKDYLLEGHIDSYSLAGPFAIWRNVEAAEDALFTERERARITLDSIGDAVISTDILGNITYLNAVAEKMTGWSTDETLGQAFREDI